MFVTRRNSGMGRTRRALRLRPGPRLAAPLLLAGLLLPACDRSPTAVDDRLEPVRDLTAAEARVSSSNTAFGLRLLREVAAAELQPNVLISPLSASMALGMTLNGAHGTTYDAMRATLGFEGLTEEQINAAYRGLIAQLRARDPQVEFALANAIWHERSFAVQPAFLEAARAHFGAEVGALDFASPAAISTINGWVAQQTGDRIRDLIDYIDPLDVMFLINAVYFKAPWNWPFSPQATRPEPFVTGTGAVVSAPMMTRDWPTPFMREDGVQMVELLYGDSAFSMVLLAPSDRTAPLADLLARLTPALWDAWLGRMRMDRAIVRMPKFRFDYESQMKAPLSRMGMGEAFVPRVADFRRINPDRNDLHISRVVQKSFIDVHELGTEAAAATVVVGSLTSMPPEFTFDRPFLFAIRERSTGTILFLGRVGDPRG
jgi:serine protease inhibitor